MSENKSVIAFSLSGILSGKPDVPGKPPGKYVYQKTKAGLGNIPGDKTRRHQIRIWTAGTNPNTTGQQVFRNKFRLGVAKWHTFSPSVKESLRLPAEKLHLNNFQLYMRKWMHNQWVHPYTTWDNESTTWDSGATTWD